MPENDMSKDMAVELKYCKHKINKLRKALEGMALYFTSANGIPVDRATIRGDSDEVKKMFEALEDEGS